MGGVPALTSADVVRVLESFGFQRIRQRGSHLRLRHPDNRVVTVPIHAGQTLGRGIRAKILRGAELTRQEFLNPSEIDCPCNLYYEKV